MLETLKSILGLKASIDFESLVAHGAKIIDVRTPSEFSSGHIKGCINIPLQDLNKKLSKLNKDNTFITCCASGVRSASAKNVLKSNGFENVYNGRGWMNLQSKIG